ncbi:MAG: hypothetical protein IKW57_01205 [Alphaproteobacteria bacterium]|nr:hypothetical protein [Alphaproteobacteria bacterium]
MRSSRQLFIILLFGTCVACGAHAAISRALPTETDSGKNTPHVVSRVDKNSQNSAENSPPPSRADTYRCKSC